MALAVWFSMSAVVPSLRQEWGIDTTAAVWLTGTVQIGFVVGALGSTLLNLADRFRPHRLLGTSAAAAAACTLALAVAVDGMTGAIPLRFLTGVFLAGVYPVGMKLMASWAEPAGRAHALGLLVGALTLGSTLPQLIAGFGSPPWQLVLLVASGLGFAGAALAFGLVRPGPRLATSQGALQPRYALRMLAQRGPLLANLGYFGHMWELYALWTWMPTFLLASPAASNLPVTVGVLAFLTMGGAGALGCIIGGRAADRFGRSRTAVAVLTISGLCCVASPWITTAPAAAVIIVCAIWGASVIADSGIFSTALSETADPRYVGTALTAQTAVGFALTVVSIQVVPIVAQAVGWRWAFLVLAVGPLVGATAMWLFGKVEQERREETAPHAVPRAGDEF